LVDRYRHASFTSIPENEAYPFGEPALESLTVDKENESEARAQYYAAVNHIDEAVGRLLGELEALGLRDETLVIYTADHGLNCGHHGFWGKGNGTLPLNMLEESIRVPMILNQPGRLPEKQTLSQFVDHTDLFQTVLQACGVQLAREQAHAYPGTSFWPLAVQLEKVASKKIQFGEYGPLRMARTDRYKLLIRYPNDPDDAAGNIILQFFDLKTDPREEVDLSGDVEKQEIIAELAREINRFFGRYEESGKSGLLGRQLPQHNFTEAWR
jgi:arylsulfatase A-like enzyme